MAEFDVIQKARHYNSYNALRAGDGGSQQDDHNLVAFSHTAGIDPQVGPVAPTLKAGHDTMPSVHAAETVVRRLTELECERLQGYPDQWTEGQSGSARYRELGNSIAVPVFAWLAERIVTVDRELSAGAP